METLIIAIALCGQPTECKLPTVCPPPAATVTIHRVSRRRPILRVLRRAGKVVKILRPFHHRRCR